jgi:hypothetical protein
MAYFVEGGCYYSFPMWLNNILPEFVSLSREEITFLGGLTYIALGAVGALLLWHSSLNWERKTEF